MAKVTEDRTIKLTNDVRLKLEQAFALDCSVKEACFYANISKQTYYNWAESFPELEKTFDRLRQKPILKARQTIVRSLDEVDTAKWYLERKRKNEFSSKTNLGIDTNKQIDESLDILANGLQKDGKNIQSEPKAVNNNTDTREYNGDNSRTEAQESNNNTPDTVR